ncbi:hypothetical protein D9758_005895 [Tetrapyrgos nigripes]|uniref:CHAT domain-containing protein n=1 Tax=Tetrapyrgos nigripes TaxID=182062 RepID=A0A8H5G2S8_9AGAR|nr:hypothetical protein D9758_005895 [Tetrapyrgos nigripes]
MDDFKRLTCHCNASIYRGLALQDAAVGQSHDVLLDRSVEIGEEIVPWLEQSIAPDRCLLTLIIVPCTQFPDVEVEYEAFALELSQAVVKHKQHTPRPDRTSASYLSVLARLHHLRFIQQKKIDYLIHAFSDIKRCLRRPTLDEYHQAIYRADMAAFYHTSFHHFGADADSNKDIEDAVENLRIAINLTKDHPRTLHPLFHYELGSMFLCRYRSGRQIKHLSEAVHYLRHSVEGITAKDIGIPAFDTCLNLLTVTLISRFNSTHESQDLDDAITYQEVVLSLLEGTLHEPGVGVIGCTSRASNVLDALTLYSTWLNMRFADSGRIGDLQTAMRWAEYVVDSTPEEDDAGRRRGISCFVNCLMNRFHAYGRIEDINRVVELVTQSDPRFAYEVGRVLMTAFERFRAKDYLDYAISCLQMAVDHAGAQQDALSNFEAVFKTHFGHHDIVAVQEIFDMFPSHIIAAFLQRPHVLALPRVFMDWVQISSRLNCFGRALTLRYETSQIREEAVIEEAMKNHLRALEVTPETSHLYPQYLLCLSTSYRVRFQVCNQLDDIDLAIRLQHRALVKAPQQHPNRIQYLTALGHSLLQLSLLSQNAEDFEAGLEYIEQAVDSPYGFHHDRLSAAVLWASIYHRSNDAQRSSDYRTNETSPTYPIDPTELLRRALKGYAKAVSLLARAASIGISSSSRLAQLYMVPRGLASDAAACAFTLAERGTDPIRAQEYIGNAIELLDQGRAILWSQAAQLRADLQLLEKQDPKLAKELQLVSDKLNNAVFSLGDSSSDIGPLTERLGEEWESLVKEVRKVEGFGDFLQPIPFYKLRRAADMGPIVIINTSDFRCDALIILPQGQSNLHIVPLKKLTKSRIEDDVSDLLKLLELLPFSDRRKFERILDGLWQTIGIPVLRALRQLGIDFSTPPHIRWCPTGRLAFLPIHAASPMRGGRGMLDYVVSSYIPTLSALLRIQKVASQPPLTARHSYPRVAAIYCSNLVSQPGMGPLPSTEKEIDILKKYAGSARVLDIVMGNAAQIDAVLSALQSVDWVHFACHGVQDVMSPMESALIFGDGRIPVSRLAGNSNLSGDFAMLLACETAMGSPGLSDEAIHVAAGLHFAGFKGIVATMWTIHDETGPEVAESVYEFLFSAEGEAEKTTSGSRRPASGKAAYALRRALLMLRDQKKRPALEWAPFIHYGM